MCLYGGQGPGPGPQEDVDVLPVPFPTVPAQDRGPGGRSAPAPDAWGKFVRKVKAALAGLPEIPNVWAPAGKGPENNVGALVTGRTPSDPRGFQACCSSSSGLPGTPAVVVTLNPGSRGGGGWLPWICQKPGPLVLPRSSSSPATPNRLLEAQGGPQPLHSGVRRTGGIRARFKFQLGHLLVWPWACCIPMRKLSGEINRTRQHRVHFPCHHAEPSQQARERQGLLLPLGPERFRDPALTGVRSSGRRCV